MNLPIRPVDSLDAAIAVASQSGNLLRPVLLAPDTGFLVHNAFSRKTYAPAAVELVTVDYVLEHGTDLAPDELSRRLETADGRLTVVPVQEPGMIAAYAGRWEMINDGFTHALLAYEGPENFRLAAEEASRKEQLRSLVRYEHHRGNSYKPTLTLRF